MFLFENFKIVACYGREELKYNSNEVTYRQQYVPSETSSNRDFWQRQKDFSPDWLFLVINNFNRCTRHEYKIMFKNGTKIMDTKMSKNGRISEDDY